jgi:hypothetical protein
LTQEEGVLGNAGYRPAADRRAQRHLRYDRGATTGVNQFALCSNKQLAMLSHAAEQGRLVRPAAAGRSPFDSAQGRLSTPLGMTERDGLGR